MFLGSDCSFYLLPLDNGPKVHPNHLVMLSGDITFHDGTRELLLKTSTGGVVSCDSSAGAMKWYY